VNPLTKKKRSEVGMSNQDNPVIAVTVYLSNKEYREYRKEAATTSQGTVSDVIRQKIGRQPTPYGFNSNPVITERQYLKLYGEPK